MGRKKNKANARDRAEQRKSGFGSPHIILPQGMHEFQIDSDKTRYIDIIGYDVVKGKATRGGNPYNEAGVFAPERTFYSHRVGEGQNTRAFVCPKRTMDLPCPVCDFLADKEYDEYKQLFPKERQLFNIYEDTNADAGVQVWDFSYHLFGALLDERIDKAPESKRWWDYVDPDEGFTLAVAFSKKTLGKNEFYEATSIDFEERQPLEDWMLEDAIDLDTALKLLPYEEIEEMFLGATQDKTESGGRRSRSRGAAPEAEPEDKAPARGRRRRPEPEPVADDEGAPEAEETAEAPARGRRRRAEPEPEETTEAPARGRRRRAEPEPEEAPSRGRRRSAPAEAEPEEKPARGRRRAEPEPEEAPAAKRGGRRATADPDPEDDPGADDQWAGWDD